MKRLLVYLSILAGVVCFFGTTTAQTCKILSPTNGQKYCSIDGSPYLIRYQPSQAVISGTGVVNTGQWSFSPFLAGPGVHKILLEYQDCRDSIFVEVVLPPDLNIAPPQGRTVFCTNETEPICFKTAPDTSFMGGSFELTPRSANFNMMTGCFNPPFTEGDYTLLYVPPMSACFRSKTFIFSIKSFVKPEISIASNRDTFCGLDANSYTLLSNIPGGTFIGRGVSGNSFSPFNAGVGNHTITYVLDGKECTQRETKINVTVETASNPFIQIKNNNSKVFCQEDQNRYPIEIYPLNAKGVLKINGQIITDNIFVPALFAVGSLLIDFEPNSNECLVRVQDLFSYKIIKGSSLRITSPAAQQRFCPNDTRFYEFKINEEVAGTFYLDGKKVTGKSFTPSTLTAGGHILKFVSEGCNYQDSVSFTVLGIAQTECADACPTPAFTEGVFVQPNYVRLTWSAGAGLYELQMRPQGGVWASRTVTRTTYTYTGLIAGKTYEFRVKAFCSNAFSDWSMLRSVTLPVTLSCDAPAFSRQTNISATRATLTWQAVPNATGYRISISGQPSVTVTALSNTFTATFLRANSVYTYSIRAICSGNRISAPSATYQFRTLTGKETEDCVNPYPYEKVEVYPNPSKGIFTVRANCGTPIRIYDLTGRIVFSSSIPNDKTELEIDITRFGTGIYVIQADGYPGAKIIVE